MKLVRFGEPGKERPGVWVESADGARVLDIRAMAFDMADFHAHFFAQQGIDRLRGLLQEAQPKLLPADGLRLGPPIARPGQIICVGKNYADHAREFDSQVPTSPILFAKSPATMTGPHDPIILPPGCESVDAEADLAVVIGRSARRLSESEALGVVAGYTVLNDVTERQLQRSAGQWFLGKSCDTFCPLGPWLVTPDEVGDPQNLRVSARLNGKPMQDGHTSQMLFGVARLIAYASTFLTLNPGDVLATGTPSGVGFARQPPIFLTAGDITEATVERIGTLRNIVQPSHE